MRKSFLAIALVLAAVLARAEALLPTAEGTSWEYESTATLPGPHRSVPSSRFLPADNSLMAKRP